MEFIGFLQRLGVSIGLGCIIGMERQFTNHSIGIRTCVLVCVGSSLFTLFPLCLPDSDVVRMASQIISGVGFLGSGIIFKDGANVRGINTAATIWCMAAIGILAGAGLYMCAGIATTCLTAVNVALRFASNRLEHWRFTDDGGRDFSLTLTCSIEEEEAVREMLVSLLSGKKTYLLSLSRIRLQNQTLRLSARFIYNGNDYTNRNEQIVAELLKSKTVCDVGWDISH